MSRTNSDKFILPPLAPSRMNRVYPRFHKFDVPGESDDLNDAMIAEDTRYVEVNSNRYPQERETVALRVQHKINEERREENRELKEINRQLEDRTRELEEENEELRMQLKLLEERENTTKRTYENVVDRLLKTMVNVESRGGKDDRLDEQIKSLTTMLLQESHDDPRISATPPSEPL